MTRERESRHKAMSLNTKRAHEKKKKWNVNQIAWRETREKSRAHRSWIRNKVFSLCSTKDDGLSGIYFVEC